MFARLQFSALTIAGVYLTAIALPTTSANPVLPRQETVPNCARNYTVHLGDTCDTISAAQNVSTYQLATVNNGTIDTACANLALDEPLCLGIAGHDCTTVHVIVSGDSCESILANAGITLGTLMENNPNVNSGCSNIYPGEVLCTATTAVYA